MHQQLKDEGFCIVTDVLSPDEINQVRAALDRAVMESERRGIPTFTAGMDPNASNVRVYTLPEFDPIFVELLRNPVALELVEELLGRHFIVSSFTANIARPGAGSMNLHADQALVVPPPWNEPWAMNIIWCLNDVHEANGATRYVPGSHLYRSFEDVPADAMEHSRPFEARAGSVIAMDGRMWHTSGRNVTDDEERALLFGYYSADFVRPQTNHEAALSERTKASLDDDARALLGLGAAANTRIGGALVRLSDDARIDSNLNFGGKDQSRCVASSGRKSTVDG